MSVDGNIAGAAADITGRLTEICSRTNLMAIDAILLAIPKGDSGWPDAALEASIVARRMNQAAADFHASIQE